MASREDLGKARRVLGQARLVTYLPVDSPEVPSVLAVVGYKISFLSFLVSIMQQCGQLQLFFLVRWGERTSCQNLGIFLTLPCG